MFARFLPVTPARPTPPVTAPIPAEKESVQRYHQDPARHRDLALKPRLRLRRARPTSVKGDGPLAAFRNRTCGHFSLDTCGDRLERSRMTVVSPSRLLPSRRKRERSPV